MLVIDIEPGRAFSDGFCLPSVRIRDSFQDANSVFVRSKIQLGQDERSVLSFFSLIEWNSTGSNTHSEEYDAELERMNTSMITENQGLQHDNKQLNTLIKEYEQTLENLMSELLSAHSNQ
jgi:hypothetical protein